MNSEPKNHCEYNAKGPDSQDLLFENNNKNSKSDSINDLSNKINEYSDSNEDMKKTIFINENDEEKMGQPPEQDSCKEKNKMANNKTNQSKDKTKKKSQKPNDNVNNINKNEKKEEKDEKGKSEINEEILNNMIKKVNESIEKMIEESQLDTDEKVYELINYLIFNVYLNTIKENGINFFKYECFDKLMWKDIFELYIKLNILTKNEMKEMKEMKEILDTIKNVLNINQHFQKSNKLFTSKPYLHTKNIIEENFKNGNETKNFQIRCDSVFKVMIGLINNPLLKKMELDKIKEEYYNMSINNNDVINNESKEETLNVDLFNNDFSENKITNINNGASKKNDSTRNSTNLEKEETAKENEIDKFCTFLEGSYKYIPNKEEALKNEKGNKIENQNIEKKVTKQSDKDFWNSDFNEIISAKSDRNLKYKIIAIKIFESLNMDGIIILTKLLTIEQGKYLKIKDPEEFERVIKSDFFNNDKYNFNLNFIAEENKIEQQFKKFAKDPISYLNKKRKRNKRK